MSLTLDQLEALLKEIGIQYYDRQDHRSCILFGMTMERYVRPDGQKSLLLVAELSDGGKYFKLFAPMAFRAQGQHVDAFLRTCMSIQWMTKLIQFEYDSSDGEIRPIVEFPILDGTITAQQLGFCVGGMTHLMEEYWDKLRAALDEGKVIDPREAEISFLERRLADLKAGRASTPDGADASEGTGPPDQL